MTDLTIPSGTRLFHGTGVKFPMKEIRGGGYDDIIWTAEAPTIAQNYIPISGLVVYASAETIRFPSKDELIQQIQEMIGIHYDHFDVKWDYMGRAISFSVPEYWDHIPKAKEIQEMLSDIGFEKPDINRPYAFRVSESRILRPDEKTLGRLFIFEAQEPVRIFDYTSGGEKEGDLTDVDYNKLNLFRIIEKKGYDGIKINDYAQSEYWGNFGHTSIGLFPRALSKFRWTTIPASNFDWGEGISINETMTPEYKSFLAGE